MATTAYRAMKQLNRVAAVGAALNNEAITRQRVDALENVCVVHASILTRGFFGRLRWLFTGK